MAPSQTWSFTALVMGAPRIKPATSETYSARCGSRQRPRSRVDANRHRALANPHRNPGSRWYDTADGRRIGAVHRSSCMPHDVPREQLMLLIAGGTFTGDFA